jgi:butyryl-CoA dehydrogenase
MIVNTAKQLVHDDLAPRVVEIDCEHKYPREGMVKLAENEFLAINVPEDLGGIGADTLSFVLATEGIAKGCPSTALVYVTHSMVANSLVVGGSDELKKGMLPKMISGDSIASFAATEPNSGSNLFAVKSHAKTDGDDLIINGSKNFITGANEADMYLVTLRTDSAEGPEDVTAILIEKDAPGLSFGKVEPMMGLRGSVEGELFFDDCRVPKANIVGIENEYKELLPKFGGLALIGTAAIALGIAQVAYDAAVEHAKNRQIAGETLSQYQGVQFMIAEMSMALSAARALTYDAAHQLDNSEAPSRLPLYNAKLYATEMAIEVSHKALQVHGGNGYSQDFPLERLYRDARGLTLHFTPSEMLKGMLGKMAMGMAPY